MVRTTFLVSPLTAYGGAPPEGEPWGNACRERNFRKKRCERLPLWGSSAVGGERAERGKRHTLTVRQPTAKQQFDFSQSLTDIHSYYTRKSTKSKGDIRIFYISSKKNALCRGGGRNGINRSFFFSGSVMSALSARLMTRAALFQKMIFSGGSPFLGGYIVANPARLAYGLGRFFRCRK